PVTAAEVSQQALPVGPLEPEVLVAGGAPVEGGRHRHDDAVQLVRAHGGVGPARNELKCLLALEPLATLERVHLEEARLLDQDDPHRPGPPAHESAIADHGRECLDDDRWCRDPLKEGGAAGKDRDHVVGPRSPTGELIRRGARLHLDAFASQGLWLESASGGVAVVHRRYRSLTSALEPGVTLLSPERTR